MNCSKALAKDCVTIPQLHQFYAGERHASRCNNFHPFQDVCSGQNNF